MGGKRGLSYVSLPLWTIHWWILGAVFAVRVETGVMSTQKWAGMFYDQFVTYCESPYALPYTEDADSASANPVSAPLSKALTALQDDYGIVRTPEEQKAFEDFCRAAKCRRGGAE